MEIKNLFSKTKEFVKKNLGFFFIFILSLGYFIFQHAVVSKWDFYAYVLNARYLFSSGGYFELYRAPLISLILGIFLPLGKLAEYLYIILISILFFFAFLKLSDVLYKGFFRKFNLKKESFRFVFLFFIMSPFVLYYSFFAGTELLSLSLFMFFLYFLLSQNNWKKDFSGLFLGLTFLARYNYLVFLPLLFFSKSPRKIFSRFVQFSLVVFPWFLFNYIKFGNPFASIADSYYLNVLSRTDIIMTPKLIHFFNLGSIYSPFFILGLFLGFYLMFQYCLSFFKSRKSSKKVLLSKKIFVETRKWFYKNRFVLLFLFIFIVVSIDYLKTPHKFARYLFPGVISVAFFSSLFLTYINSHFFSKARKNVKIFSLLIVLLVFLASLNFLIINDVSRNNINKLYTETIEEINGLNLSHCHIKSTHWAPLNYYQEQFSFLGSINDSLSMGELVLIYPGSPTYDDPFEIEDLEKYNKILNKGSILILAPKGFSKENTDLRCKKYSHRKPEIVEDHCSVVSRALKIFKNKTYKYCNFLERD